MTRPGADELADPDVDLQHPAFDRRPDGQPVQRHLRRADPFARDFGGGPRRLHLGARRLKGELRPRQPVLADRHAGTEPFGAAHLVLEVGELGLRLGDIGRRRRRVAPGDRELRLGQTAVEDEQRLAGAHPLPLDHRNGGDDPGDEAADGDVPRIRLDEAAAGDGRGVGVLRRQRELGRGGRFASRQHRRIIEGVGDAGRGQHRQSQAQHAAVHGFATAFAPSSMPTMRPSSMRAMRSAKGKMRLSWVTISTVVPRSRTMPRISSSTFMPVS